MIGNLARLHLLSYLSLKDFLIDVKLDDDAYYKIEYTVPNLNQVSEGERIRVERFVQKVEAIKDKLNALDDDSPMIYHFDDQQIMGRVQLEIPSEHIADFIGIFGRDNRTLEGYQYCLKQLEKEEKENYPEELDLLTEDSLLDDALEEYGNSQKNPTEKDDPKLDPDDLLDAALADFENSMTAKTSADEKDDSAFDSDDLLDAALADFENFSQKNPQKKLTEKALIARTMKLQFTKGKDASDKVASLGLEEMQGNLASLRQRNNTFNAGFLVQSKQPKQQKKGLPTDLAIRNVLLADQLYLLGKIEEENLVTALMQLTAIFLEEKEYELAGQYSVLAFALEDYYKSSSEEILSAPLLKACQYRYDQFQIQQEIQQQEQNASNVEAIKNKLPAGLNENAKNQMGDFMSSMFNKFGADSDMRGAVLEQLGDMVHTRGLGNSS